MSRESLLDEAIAKAKEAEDWQLVEWLRMARGGESAARWYTAKLGEARLDMSKLMAENAKLRDELENARMRGDDLASSISEWRAVTEARGQTIDRLAAENAKLRELVSGLEHCCQGFPCNRCPLYDPSGTNHHRCESLERELGIEVDE